MVVFSTRLWHLYYSTQTACGTTPFCEWIDLGVEIDEDWYSVGNIEYDALDDLRGDFPQLFEEDDVPINGWDEMVQEPIEHDEEDFTNEM
jgi:hypothetical protein